MNSKLDDLQSQMKTVQLLSWLSLAFSAVSTAILFCIGFCKVSKAKKKHGGLVPLFRKKFISYKHNSKKEACKTVAVDLTGLKLATAIGPETPAPPTCSTNISTTPPTFTTFKQRSPSEDNTLDYTYDNAGMSPSPTTFAKGVEFNTKGELRF